VSLKSVLIKIAEIGVEDVEDRVGTYFTDNEEDFVRHLIGKEEEKSWSMRHPYMSLGYGPLFAEPKAMDNIVNGLLRRDMMYRRSMRSKEHAADSSKLRQDPEILRRQMVRSLIERISRQQGAGVGRGLGPGGGQGPMLGLGMGPSGGRGR